MENTFPGLIPQDAKVVSYTEVLKIRLDAPDRPSLGSIVSWQGRFYRVDRIDLSEGVITLTRAIEV